MWANFILLGIIGVGKLITAEPGITTTSEEPRYVVLDEAPVGEGSGTVVRMVRRVNDSQVLAAKFFDSYSERDESIIRQEFMFGHAFTHDNIARSIDMIEGSPTACIIMEYFPTEMLEVLVTRELSRAQISVMFKQILSGTAHMHSLGIAHRDLKMDNVVLDENGNAKIIDFGSASIGRHLVSGNIEWAHGLRGSKPFAAPECHGEGKYDAFMADVWSLGVLYISMILGDLPWDSATADDEAFVNAFSPNDNDRGLLLAFMPPESRSLVKNMLNINPSQRPSIVDIFADPWIGNIRI